MKHGSASADNVGISVIVPVFNDQAGINRCLQALKVQTAAPGSFEIVVVDNGSEPAINVAALDQRVRLVRCATPGSYAARNAGVAAASGENFAFTDADCEPSPDWIKRGAAALAASPRAIIGGDVSVLPPTRRTGTGLYQHIIGFRQRENIEHRGFAVTANMFCSRDDFLTIGNFDASLLSGGDMEWGLRARGVGIPTIYAPDIVVRTPPRISLSSAVRQARRVAGGRRQLDEMIHDWGEGKHSRHRRGRVETLVAAARSHNLSPKEAARVAGAAIAIYLATVLETMRLAFGGRAERR